LKKILCIIFAIPKAVLNFVKHVICCLGLILLLLALAALIIFLLRTFCDQVVSLIDFLFFTGGSAIFPFRAYGYTVSSIYNYSSSKGLAYGDLVFLWNESVPNISMLVKSLLDMLSQVHDALFTQLTSRYDVETTILILSQRVGFIYEFAVGVVKAFLEADVTELQNLSMISNQLTRDLIQNQMEVSKCLVLYPQLGFQCLLVSTMLGSSQQTVLYRGNYYNPGRQLMAIDDDDNGKDNYYVPGNSDRVNSITSMVSYACSSKLMESYKICRSIKRVEENLNPDSSSLVGVLLRFLVFDLQKDVLEKYQKPSDVIYSGEFQEAFTAIKNLHASYEHGSLEVKDHRMSIDYAQWLRSGNFGNGDPLDISRIADMSLRGATNDGKRSLKIALYPPIVGCFNYIPPDPLCILQGFLPLPFSTTGVWNTIVTAINGFSCDCSSLGYSDDPFFFVFPVFTNTWLIIKTIISGIFSIPVFSSLVSAITIPSWIQNVFFLDAPGTPLTADQVMCAVLHLDYAIEFLMALLILWALLESILHAICQIIECCAQLRILREVMILSYDGIINPKKVNLIEQEIIREIEPRSVSKSVTTETRVANNRNADKKDSRAQRQFEKYKENSTSIDPSELDSGVQTMAASAAAAHNGKKKTSLALDKMISTVKDLSDKPLTKQEIADWTCAYYQARNVKMCFSRKQTDGIFPAILIYKQRTHIGRYSLKLLSLCSSGCTGWVFGIARSMRSNHKLVRKLSDMDVGNLRGNH